MDTRQGRRIRAHRAIGLSDNGADTAMFFHEAEGREMSVAEYYELAYGIRWARHSRCHRTPIPLLDSYACKWTD